MRRKLTSFLLAAAAVVALSSSPIYAGAVYVPVEPMSPGDQVFVSVSNPTGEEVAFTYYLAEHNTDGTVRPEDLPVRFLAPGETAVLRSQLPQGQRGLLEINASAHLPVSARLGKVSDTPDSVMGPSVPVISSDNAEQAGSNVYIQGLQRQDDGAITSNVRIVNLGHGPATCNATINKADGGVLGGFLNFPDRLPLSVTAFDDGLALVLGNGQFGDLRVRVSCDQLFYAYSVTHEAETGSSVLIAAASSTDSALRPPGEDLPCPTDSFCFEQDGVFHVPVSGNKVKRLMFPTPPGDYTRVHMNMEVKLGNWQNPSSGLHNIFWLALDRNRNLIGYTNLKGPNANTVLFRHGFGQPQEDKAKVVVPAIFVPGQTYEFDYVYDTAVQLIELQIFDSSGQLVAQIVHSPDVNKIKVTNNDIILADFGFLGINPNEPASFGWSYQNLTMTISP